MSNAFLKSISISVVLAAATTLTARCDPTEAQGHEYFEKHIRPLLVERCYSCHSTKAAKSEGGLRLDSRPSWSEGGDRGPAIVPGNADASLLIKAVRYTDPDLQMPPDQKLSDEAIALLEKWVALGAPDPREQATASDAGRPNPSDPVRGRDHWAFRPLGRSLPSPVQSPEWPRTTIDSFVLARLEAANLRPTADADRRDLIRRLYVQLIGLPPSVDQVAHFLNDSRPNAYERLVEELLSSPHFGERWGRHWLDLARYADSNGLDENFLFREAWRYRNWVIREVNADTPYDRFLLQQIAGDLLPFDSIDQRDRQRIAAGFLLIGPKVLLGNKEKNQRMEVADEQLDTIGKAVLGQTLGCARCHDHKFDPIPTADYYALAGIFTSTQVMERRYMLNEQRVMERLVGLGAEGEKLDDAYEMYWRERPKLIERQKQAKAALELLEKQIELEKSLDELRNKEAAAIAAGSAEASDVLRKRFESQKALVAEMKKAVESPPAIPPRAMIPSDRETPADEFIRLAGQTDRLGSQVPRGYLRVISDTPATISPGTSGRVELARWLTDLEHGAGQLAARVLANRVWHHLIGRGIVRTVDNFGRTGEEPSHPELLDYLATRLIDSDWSVKELVREIVLSRTFTMCSDHSDQGHAVDPDNRLLWRAHRRRLDPESLRDAMLFAADQLDVKPMDSSVWYLGDQATAVGDNKVRRRTNFPCRSVYLPVIRNDLPELFDVFDFANPHQTTGMRPSTMMATQGLYLLNDEAVMAAAEATAKRLFAPSVSSQPGEKVDRLYELVLNSPATDADRSEITAFVAEMREQLITETARDARPRPSSLLGVLELAFAQDSARAEKDAELRAWSLACHALFASSRFQVLE